MLKKSVSFDENRNQIRYYEKEQINYYNDYLPSICKYLCSMSEYDENIKDDEYIILKSGKKIKKNT